MGPVTRHIGVPLPELISAAHFSAHRRSVVSSFLVAFLCVLDASTPFCWCPGRRLPALSLNAWDDAVAGIGRPIAGMQCDAMHHPLPAASQTCELRPVCTMRQSLREMHSDALRPASLVFQMPICSNGTTQRQKQSNFLTVYFRNASCRGPIRTHQKANSTAACWAAEWDFVAASRHWAACDQMQPDAGVSWNAAGWSKCFSL